MNQCHVVREKGLVKKLKFTINIKKWYQITNEFKFHVKKEFVQVTAYSFNYEAEPTTQFKFSLNKEFKKILKIVSDH